MIANAILIVCAAGFFAFGYGAGYTAAQRKHLAWAKNLHRVMDEHEQRRAQQGGAL